MWLTGKTIVFANIAAQRSQTGRVLVLAHRDELIRQAADKIQMACGLTCAVEKAEETALGSFYNITCGSVQTLMRQSRLERFPRDYYGTIIVDEAHHALSDSYRNILEYWNGAKVLGVLAFPNKDGVKAYHRALKEYYEGADALFAWIVQKLEKRRLELGLPYDFARRIDFKNVIIGKVEN